MKQGTYRQSQDYGYLTPVNVSFAAVNVVVFFVLSAMGNVQDGWFMFEHGAMFPPAVLEGEWYRLLTSSFHHFGMEHLVNNMLMLICLGSYLEREFGRIKYLIFYLASAVLSSVCSMWWMLRSGDFSVSAGASGVVFAMIGALLYLVLRNRGRFQNLTLTRFLIMAVLSLYFGFVSAGVDNAAHIGGLCAGFFLGIVMYRKRKYVKQ